MTKAPGASALGRTGEASPGLPCGPGLPRSPRLLRRGGPRSLAPAVCPHGPRIRPHSAVDKGIPCPSSVGGRGPGAVLAGPLRARLLMTGHSPEPRGNLGVRIQPWPPSARGPAGAEACRGRSCKAGPAQPVGLWGTVWTALGTPGLVWKRPERGTSFVCSPQAWVPEPWAEQPPELSKCRFGANLLAFWWGSPGSRPLTTYGVVNLT